MNAEVLNARALTMRVGAVLAAFVLAFSLLLLAPSAHASMLGWHNTRFSGDEVIFTSKTRMSESEGGDAATADICTEAQKNVGTTVWGSTITRAYLDHYLGMQVCAVESKATLEAMLNGTARSELFAVMREGEKIKVKGIAPHDTVQYSNTYSFTFDGGISAASSANIVGNTATVFGNVGLYDATFEVVGSTKASASAKPSSSGTASLSQAFLRRLALLALRLVTRLNRKRLLLMQLQLGLAQPARPALPAPSGLLAVTTPLFMGSSWR